DSSIRVWDASSGKLLRELRDDKIPANLAFSPDGKRMAVGNASAASSLHGGEIKLWDITTGKIIRTLEPNAGSQGIVVFSPDGKWIAGGGNGTIKFWDASSGKVIRAIARVGTGMLCLAVAPDGKRLVSTDFDNTIKVWDVSSG